MTMTGDSSITCSDACARWLRSVDEGIDDQIASRHVQTCAECLALAREMSVVLGGLSELKRATQSVEHSIDWVRVDSIALPSRRRPLVIRRVLWRVAAAVAILVTGAYVGLRPREFARQDARPIASRTTVEKSPPPVSIRLLGQSKSAYVAVADVGSTPDVQVIRLYPIVTRTHEQANYPISRSSIRSKENHQ